MTKQNLTTATICEVVTASVAAKGAAVGTDPFDQGTAASGTCRRLSVDTSDGTVKAVGDYHAFWNFTTTALSIGDHIVVVPTLDENGATINGCVEVL